MRRVWLTMVIGGICCSGKADDSDIDTASRPDTAENTPDQLAFEQAFTVPEWTWDLAEHSDGRIFASAQGGGKLYSWDPVTEDRDEETDEIPGILALAFSGDNLYLTTTDEGVLGTLSILEGRFAETLFEQADNGTLFRKPADLLATPEGGWIIADVNAGVLFTISTNGSVSTLDGGSEEPQALTFANDQLYIGGDDGVWRMGWPSGLPIQIDERPALGLHLYNGTIWASNANEQLFEPGGETFGVTEIARPGSIVGSSERLFVADRGGQHVWSLVAE